VFDKVKELINSFFKMLDAEGVVLFQVLYCVTFIVMGAQNRFVAHAGPITLHGTMGYLSISSWCWAMILGPICWITGKLIYWLEPPGVDQYRPGRILMFTGNISMSFALMSYIIATFHVEPWGHGGFGGYLASASWLSILVLIFRDIRRFREQRFPMESANETC
jgi:hypothetical protein